jgi:hypothetical protein
MISQMLQALVKHYDIGKDSKQNDFVGVLSPHPFTVCALLRVFGRGIESIPSKQDWERRPIHYTYAPLQSTRCAPLMEGSPIEHVRNASLFPDTLTPDTRNFVGHRATEMALTTLSYGMNRQVREPWQWMFGNLAEGGEYLCVLEYRYDDAYDMRPRFCDRELASPGKVIKGRRVPKTLATYCYKTADDRPSIAVKYAELNDILIKDPRKFSLVQDDVFHIDVATEKAIAQLFVDAMNLLDRDTKMIARSMDARPMPEEIRALYTKSLWNGTMFIAHPVPVFLTTWRELKEWTIVMFDSDPNALPRLQLLQAIHFMQVSDEIEERRKELKKEVKLLEKAKMHQQKKESKARKEEKQKLATRRTSFGALHSMAIHRFGLPQRIRRRSLPAGMASPPCPVRQPSKPEHFKEHAEVGILLKVLDLQPEPPSSTLQEGARQPIQEITAIKPEHAMQSVELRRTDSPQQQNVRSPTMFHSPEQSLEEVFSSRFPVRTLPRNAGEVLRKGKIGAG